jgi:4-amino-4-deoxy-L-arabinose transferase-like glycosyltransferase
MGGQISWLLPAALIAIAALVVLSRRSPSPPTPSSPSTPLSPPLNGGRRPRLPRTDRTRAAAIVWGGWLLVTGVLLSYASGIIHSYYTVELAPAVAALVGIGAVTLWRHRHEVAARWTMAAGVLVTGVWSYQLLHRSPTWQPWVSYTVLAAALGCAAAIAQPAGRIPRAAVLVGVTSAVAVGGGSAAYAANTAATPHTGSIVSAGPVASGGTGGGRRTGGPQGGFGTGAPPTGRGNLPGGTPPNGGTGSLPGTGTGSGTGTVPGGPGGAGGGSATTSAALTALLKATTTKWAAATIGSQSAAPLELASGKAVISIGGFNGGDNAPTLAQFQQLVAQGQVRYFIGGGQGGSFIGGGQGGSSSGGSNGGGSSSGGGSSGGSGSAISTWVAAHFTSTTVGGTTVYDLTKAAS